MAAQLAASQEGLSSVSKQVSKSVCTSNSETSVSAYKAMRYQNPEDLTLNCSAYHKSVYKRLRKEKVSYESGCSRLWQK
jgi:hypothetical protein